MPRTFARLALVAALASGISACASTDPFAGLAAERGVFASPYVAPQMASRQGIGPEPEGVLPGRRPYLDTLIYPGRGRHALDRRGNIIRLSRHDRRLLQERHERLRQRAEQVERERREGRSGSSAPPLAAPSPRALSHGGGSLPR
jgi:hypothetical protein